MILLSGTPTKLETWLEDRPLRYAKSPFVVAGGAVTNFPQPSPPGVFTQHLLPGVLRQRDLRVPM